MSDKKKPGRFTIQFDLKDPQQRAAACLLEQHGRRKAQFITSAVLSYTHDPNHLPASEDTFEQKILSVIRSHPEIIPSQRENCPARPGASSSTQINSQWDSMGDSDTFRAITETLADFQRSRPTI